MVSLDPPDHTARRKVAQRGFTRGHMRALEPEIVARAHRLIDGFAADGACDLMNAYALELTTQTICALLDLPEQDEAWFRGIRFDSFRVLAAAQEPIPDDEIAAVWDRYAAAHERLREIVDERRDGDGTDVITEMAKARDADGGPLLSTEWIALHVTELAAAGTDTTAQLICNAAAFLSRNEEQLAEAIADPELWVRVVEESLRRRPSAPFVSRRATRDVEIAGVTIPEGDWVWFSLASASNDPAALRRAGALRHPSARSGRSLRVQQGAPRMRGLAARARRGPGRAARAVRATARPACRPRPAARLRAAGDAADPAQHARHLDASARLLIRSAQRPARIEREPLPVAPDPAGRRGAQVRRHQ